MTVPAGQFNGTVPVKSPATWLTQVAVLGEMEMTLRTSLGERIYGTTEKMKVCPTVTVNVAVMLGKLLGEIEAVIRAEVGLATGWPELA